MQNKNRNKARPDRVVLSLPVVRGNGRIVQLGAPVRAKFRFEPYVDDDGKATSAAAAALDRPVFDSLDDALERIASWAPGHTCTAKSFAFVPHNLTKDGMRAAFVVDGAKHTAFWCEAAGLWVGFNLRDVGEAAERANGVRP